jgi:hypothetical protein
VLVRLGIVIFPTSISPSAYQSREKGKYRTPILESGSGKAYSGADPCPHPVCSGFRATIAGGSTITGSIYRIERSQFNFDFFLFYWLFRPELEK